MQAIRRLVAGLRTREYTVAQAAVITGLSQAKINHYIARDLATLDVAIWGEGRRTLTYDGLVALRIAHDYQNSLVPSARVDAIRQAIRLPRKKHAVLQGDGKLTVPVGLSRAAVADGLQRLHAAVSLVESDLGTLQGEPCFKGTRIPVYVVAGIAKEVGVGQAKLTYPRLTKSQIELACVYAVAHPRRGRPKRVGEVLSKRKPKTSRTFSVTIG